MVRVAIPVLAHTVVSDLLTPRDALERSSDLFTVELVAAQTQPAPVSGVTIAPHRTTRSRIDFDLVVVPSLGFDLDRGVRDNAAYLPWLARQFKAGAVVASWCTGAFLIAEAGLLSGRRATTHWASARAFEARFPDTTLEADRMLVDEGHLITAAGATSIYLLVLHLLQRYGGPALAVDAARLFLVDANRPSQLPYADTRAFEGHSDPTVHKVQRYVALHLRDQLTLETLARQAGVSSKTLSRIFKREAQVSPIAFVQAARVQAAKELLARGHLSFDAITYKVGYTDPRAFRRLFKRLSGLSPRAYRDLAALPPLRRRRARPRG